MPTLRNLTANKGFIQRSVLESQIKVGKLSNNSTKSFAELKNELFVIDDRSRMFALTWRQVMAVMVLVSCMVILVLLRA